MAQQKQGEYLYVIFTSKRDSLEPKDLEMAICPRVVDLKNRKGHIHLRDQFLNDHRGEFLDALTGGVITHPSENLYLVMEISDDVSKTNLSKEQFLAVSKKMQIYDGKKWTPKDSSDIIGNNIEKVLYQSRSEQQRWSI